jgi:hypothetical protein
MHMYSLLTQSWYVSKIWRQVCPGFSDMNSGEMAAPHRDKLGLYESGSHSVMASPHE